MPIRRRSSLEFPVLAAESRVLLAAGAVTRAAQSVDTDGDGLSDAKEKKLKTDPNKQDTDGDLLPDGFEAKYPKYLNPLTKNDPNADSDGDGLTDLQELINQTRPDKKDSDNDKANDKQELDQGSNPTNKKDKGQAPSPEDLVEIELTVGDHSGSHSERYVLQVGRIQFQSAGFGIVSTARFKVLKCEELEVKIIHVGSNLSTPDYDYTARIREIIPTGGSSSIEIRDTSGILGVHNESNSFYAAGKTATLRTARAPENSYGDVVSAEFLTEAKAIASRLGCTVNDLMGVMAAETGGTFDPKEKAGSFVGLIQFGVDAAKELGTTTSALAAMTAVQQLGYVEKWLKKKLDAKGVTSPGIDDLYAAVFAPAFVGKGMDEGLYSEAASPKSYKANKSLDTDHDGVITKRELSARAEDWRARGLLNCLDR